MGGGGGRFFRVGGGGRGRFFVVVMGMVDVGVVCVWVLVIFLRRRGRDEDGVGDFRWDGG